MESEIIGLEFKQFWKKHSAAAATKISNNPLKHNVLSGSNVVMSGKRVVEAGNLRVTDMIAEEKRHGECSETRLLKIKVR